MSLLSCIIQQDEGFPLPLPFSLKQKAECNHSPIVPEE
jgi:hypothetical protein